MASRSVNRALLVACFAALSACSSTSDSADTIPFVDPGTANGGTNSADPNGNAGGSNGGDGMDAGSSGNANTQEDGGASSGMDASDNTQVDSGNTQIGDMDSGMAAEDASGKDQDAGTNGSANEDAAVADAGRADDDAGSVSDDAGTLTDAGTEGDAGPSCGTDGLVAGNDCPGVVTCQDNNLSGNPVLECTLTGSKPSLCCTTNLLASNSCRTSACGNGDDQAKCDGPEDCADSAKGGLCCFSAGATDCAATCTAPNRMCHSDADCANGTTCEAGFNDRGTSYSWWGFCRGK